MKQSLSKKKLWESMPRWIRNPIGRSLWFVPRPYFLGARFRRTMRFIEESQWWNAERTRLYQLEHLRRICTLAYERTSYYRSSWEKLGFHPEDLQSLQDIAALPTIDKETIREYLGQMMTVPADSKDIDYVSTGGSSGTTLRFYIGKDRSAIEYAYLVSAWQRAGYRLGIPMAVIRGRVLKRGRRYEYDPLLRHHYYSNFDMTDENMSWYLQHISRIGPCFLHVYPSSAANLAAFCKRTGTTMPRNILGILAESETVYPEHRDMLATVCSARLFSCYGHSEKLVAAAECEHSTMYHVSPTYGYCELLDEAGRPVNTVGQMGEIVGTGFINHVTPFIRYRTGDYATYAGNRCEACGREFMLLSKIEGRLPQGALVASDGSLISMTALNLHDDTFEHIRQYQFYQDTPGKAVLRVLPLKTLDVRDIDNIRRGLEPKLAGHVQLSIQKVDAIQLTERGKFKLVEQRIEAIETHPLAHTTGR